MTSRTAAARYARALLDVASKEAANVDAVGAELNGFAQLLRDNQALERVLLNPAVPAARKQAAVAELARIAGLSPIVSKLLVLLAGRDRMSLLNDLAALYRDMLMDRQNVVRAEVTTAVVMPEARVTAIERRLADITGKKVSMSTKVDANIIGGLVARIGGTVYDASVATQLKKIRDRLTT